MKKRIMAGLLSIGLLLSLGGCSTAETEIEKRFISTEEVVKVSGGQFEIVYDQYTKIVYLSSISDFALTPLIGADKQPMTIDEYKATR